MPNRNPLSAGRLCLVRQFATLNRPASARCLNSLFGFSALRRIVPVAVFAIAIASAQAGTLTVTYTDAFSDSASLVLTGTTAADGGFQVTDVTGVFNGSAVDGPLSGYTASDEFYTDPSILPDDTVDSGFYFETSGGAQTVELYEYNYEGVPGYATTVSGTGSGAAFITGISSSPEPATATMGFGALLLLVGWRKFALRHC